MRRFGTIRPLPFPMKSMILTDLYERILLWYSTFSETSVVEGEEPTLHLKERPTRGRDTSDEVSPGGKEYLRPKVRERRGFRETGW